MFKRFFRNLYMMMGIFREDIKKIWKVFEFLKVSGVILCVISWIKNDIEGKEKLIIEIVVKFVKVLNVDFVELLK